MSDAYHASLSSEADHQFRRRLVNGSTTRVVAIKGARAWQPSPTLRSTTHYSVRRPLKVRERSKGGRDDTGPVSSASAKSTRVPVIEAILLFDVVSAVGDERRRRSPYEPPLSH